jgi:hypothetical protein
MIKGFTKSYRKELDGDIWKMPPLYQRVFFFLRLKAKYKSELFPTRKKYGIWLNPGQWITSIDIIAHGVSWLEWGKEKIPNKKPIKDILVWLESNDMIQVESNAYGTYINIVKWSVYHPDQEEKVTISNQDKVTENKRLLDTIKELKKELKKKSLKEKPKKEYSLYGEFNNVKLTDEDYKKLQVKYNGTLNTMIETLSQHIASKKKDPYTGKTHYPAILKNDHWLNKEKGGKGEQSKFNNLKEQDYHDGAF